ncbi:hypothetical protein EVAR_34591_1 [Eumeta japonica]|uniref:Uncharacterized protein n=1 Tax=Eumeta variegata TaxID=151549 RepID=A0A4C1VFD6_EUMVA|nr:hypothetical protein EVAR_34591_1 [Eumeta japonica]
MPFCDPAIHGGDHLSIRHARCCPHWGTRFREEATSSRTISVDAMTVFFETGEVLDRLGCSKASEVHEVVVYEVRGENLNYLLQRTQ